MGERTGSRVFQYLWSYVIVQLSGVGYITRVGDKESRVSPPTPSDQTSSRCSVSVNR
ncbi:hypothetical protein B0T18DRAFT_396662 [Schizothecium vesticola]|uniref:Uncharacterized protein n=1 Tax=Schizothecium vesticola TaxID=314040 RepID=A0AA40KC05_9PEZI|nr:hypothetical protein B0T18DRAFT_396662 [Schizothecium vesticola]